MRILKMLLLQVSPWARRIWARLFEPPPTDRSLLKGWRQML